MGTGENEYIQYILSQKSPKVHISNGFPEKFSIFVDF